jgi:hypothetical protein
MAELSYTSGVDARHLLRTQTPLSMGILHLAMGQAMDVQPFAKRIGRLLPPRCLIDELRRPLGHVGLALSGRNTGRAAPR